VGRLGLNNNCYHLLLDRRLSSLSLVIITSVSIIISARGGLHPHPPTSLDPRLRTVEPETMFSAGAPPLTSRAHNSTPSARGGPSSFRRRPPPIARAAAAAAADARARARPRRPSPLAAMASPSASSSAVVVTDDLVALAHDLVEAAGRVTTSYFRTGVLADTKSDDSPVTVADRLAEQAMRALLAERAPTHAVFGEEYGLSAAPVGQSSGSNNSNNNNNGNGKDASSSSAAAAAAAQANEGKLGDVPEWLWVLDPIDGTKSFVTGKPLFGTLAALLHRGVPVLGVIDQPITRERWLGVAGRPTTLNGRPIRTRACPRLGDAYAYATTPHMFAPGATEESWHRVRDAVRIPLYGCDCYAYGLLAAGHVDLVVEADLKPYDYLALVPVVEGAGGVITDWRGEGLRWRPGGEGAAGGGGEVVAAGDARTHAEALALLGWK
jgi:inositol-phosphate phosphatase / L-galactose 1-phosphate phosphatase / histidinol-phosphatase